jgi:hypothetical protein
VYKFSSPRYCIVIKPLAMIALQIFFLENDYT